MKKILVVDDNAKNLMNAVDGITELGYEVLSASSATEAIKIIEEISMSEDIFIVMTDMSMETEKAGLKVLNLCNKRCVPCLIVTGGLDHGRPSVSVLCDMHFPTFRETQDGRSLYYLDSFLAEEKNKEIWKRAINTFIKRWNETGLDLVNYAFCVRQEYRKQKDRFLSIEEQFNFQAGIVPERSK